MGEIKEKPIAERFAKPTQVSKAESVFGAKMDILLPPYDAIPNEFKSMHGVWPDWQAKWFYSGLQQMPTPKPGIDVKEAMRHLGTIQGSFDPKHEHKAAGVAYLASLWFEKP